MYCAYSHDGVQKNTGPINVIMHYPEQNSFKKLQSVQLHEIWVSAEYICLSVLLEVQPVLDMGFFVFVANVGDLPLYVQTHIVLVTQLCFSTI